MTLVAIALAGCSAGPQPIYNVTNAPIVLPPDKAAAPMTNVASAILRAGSRLGWQMTQEGPGRLAGRLVLRQHSAVVDIEHDTRSYSINYRDSSNLDAADGTIHPEYNRWIQNLNNMIRAELGMAEAR